MISISKKGLIKAALDPCSLMNSLAIYFDGVSCCKCLILRILNTDSFKTYQGYKGLMEFYHDCRFTER